MKRSAIIREILKTYEQRRIRAEQLRREKVDTIYKKIPQLAAVDESMNRQGLAITRALLADPDQQQRLLEELETEMNRLREKRARLLEQHGLTESDFQPPWTCFRCRDRGILPDGSHCNCFRQQLITRAYQMSNLAGILEKENFKTYRVDLFSATPDPEEGLSPRDNMLEILTIAEGFAINFEDPDEKNLLFYGPTGLGKTFTANCIAKSLLDSEKTVVYQTAIKLMDLLESYYFHKTRREEDPQALERLTTCDLLIIDDLGTELTNSFTNSQLFQLINTRQLEERKTLISTNLPPSALMDRYDDRICSRLFAHYRFVNFFGQDLRWEKDPDQ